MAGARSVIYKRPGPVTEAERDLVTKFVADQPAELTNTQVNALARVLRRTKETTKNIIADAKDRLIDNATFYVDVHKNAVAAAYASDTVAGQEQAIKGAQWALENISGEGARIIDAAAKGPQGSKVMIGIQMGGVDAPKVGVSSE